MGHHLSRRSVLATIAGTGALGLAGCLGGFEAEASGPSDSWPSFRYDAGNSGYNPDASGPKDDLEVSMEYAVEPPESEIGPGGISSPIVLGDRVFVAFDHYADGETHLVAIDRNSGDEDWLETFEYEIERGSSVFPAYTLESDGESLFLATKVNDESTLRGIDPETGEERWSEPLGESLRSPLTAVDGTLYAGENVFAAFDADDGSLEYRYEWDDDETGEEKDRYPPTVADDAVYVGVRDTLYAWDRDDGSLLWTTDSPFESWTYDGGTSFYQPVVDDGVVYAATGDHVARDLGGMVALSSDEGEQLWQTQPDRESGTPDPDAESREEFHATLFGLPIVLEDTIVALGAEYGEWGLFGLDPDDGSIRWVQDEAYSIPLVAADDVVYVTGEGSGWAAAIDPDDGEVLGHGSFEVDNFIQSGQFPAIVDEHLYVATSERVVAFGPSE